MVSWPLGVALCFWSIEPPSELETGEGGTGNTPEAEAEEEEEEEEGAEGAREEDDELTTLRRLSDGTAAPV